MRFRSIPIGLLLALLLVGVAAAQSGGPYDLGWSTLDDGGGMFSTGGSYVLGGSIAQHDASGPLSGGVYAVTGGFWPGILASPRAVTDLRGSIKSGLLRLDWTAMTADTDGTSLSGATYDVFRAADQPYFTPGAAYASGVTGITHTDPDTGVIGNTAHSHYYLIRAVHGGLISTGSNRVGAFSFGLTPGSP